MRALLRRRPLLWGAGVAAVVALVALAAVPRPVPVDVGAVVRGPLQVTLSEQGTTRARHRYLVSAPVAGHLSRIELAPGDAVKAGETVLAVIEPSTPAPLDARAQAEAEARVRAARSVLAVARAERDRAAVRADFARAQLERLRRLFADGAASRESLEAAEAEARGAAGALQAAEFAVIRAQNELEAAEAALTEPQAAGGGGAGEARRVALRAPGDGVVLRRLHDGGAVVAAGQPLLEIGDIRQLEVVADFFSTDAVRMRPGMPAIIDRWGGETPLRGSVRQVEPHGFTKTSTLGVEEQRVNVIVDLDGPSGTAGPLGDGYQVEVRVVVWQEEDTLKVPTGALFRHDGGWAVFVVDRGRARLRPVEIGARNDLEAQVLSGLAEGERVLLYPPDTISDGTRVRPRPG